MNSHTPTSLVRNDLFDPQKGYTTGRPKIIFIIWYLFKIIFFQTSLPWPNIIKIFLLRFFGAEIGRNVLIKPRVNIYMPWKIEIGDNSWIGEGVEIYNFASVKIGAQCCISQRAFLCAANHDYRDVAMGYRNNPIELGDGSWVGACAFVGPSVRIGTDAVLTAGSVVTKDMPSNMVCSGNPCVPITKRWRDIN